MHHELFAGRYRIGPELGRGGIGTVYRAEDVVAGRQVAIKFLLPSVTDDPAAKARFLAEARLAAKLIHPNIVRVLDHGEVDGRCYVVMEYLPEPDLGDVIRRYAPIDQDKVAALGIDCCKALHYAHTQGVVHADVKPQNILFSKDGVPKLGDFGLIAAAHAVRRRSGRILGTAAYMAPEVAAGGQPTPQSDIYSLGCVLYHAATGRLPFDAPTAEQVMRLHIRARPVPARELNPSLTPDFDRVLARAMAKDPARRYATAAELQRDLEKVRAGRPLGQTGVLPRSQPAPRPGPAPASPTPSPERAGPQPTSTGLPGASSPSLALVALAAVIVIVLAVVLVWATKRAFYPGRAPVLVQVPSVKGLTQGEARKKLASHGLTVGAINYVTAVGAAAEGTVVDQRPEMGATVKKGTPIALTLARGKGMTTVPDVVGLKLEDATRRLEKFHLTVGEVEKRYSSSVPEGRVIKQAIDPDTKVERGAAVDLVVSRGPQPQPTQPQPPVSSEGTTQGNAEEEGEAGPAIPADVTITDLTPGRGPDEPHQYEIRVTALGRKPHQEIEVVAVDASGKRDILLHDFIDPQESKTLKVSLKGPARIEVNHEGLNILNQSVPPTNTGPLPGSLTAPGGAMGQ